MSRKRKSQKSRKFKIRILPVLTVLLIGLTVLLSYAIYLDFQVRNKFEGARWEIPSRVYARPLDLFVGKTLDPADLILELKKLRYKQQKNGRAGSFYQQGSIITVYTRKFDFPDETMPATRLRIKFNRDQIREITNLDSKSAVDIWQLEPVFIGGIYPRLNEDRVLVRLDEVPETLAKTLLAVEDRHFYEHYGVAPISILRAVVANLRAGSRVQGGSTLTQQLVKNFYLSNEKTFTRKINEAIMALLLELHYSKDEILEAYLNEVYLGQDGKRAIHGFGLAAQFYFDLPLNELNETQIALLVGLVKGASFYDPRRNPERALSRRQVVQKLQLEQKIISQKKYDYQVNLALGVSKDKPSGISPYPHFLDLVKRQLLEDYSAKDLQTAGLKLFTTLDPIMQHHTEQVIKKQLPLLERKASLPETKLQVAAAISDPGTGAIRVLIGGREYRSSGFNRALDSSRQIGSLIKPIVYLTALQNDREYRLNTIVRDDPISLTLENGQDWVPENYDKKYHDQISLMGALANSYNAAAVRLGLTVGIDNVIHNLQALGVQREIKNYPSLLLGAVDLGLFDVMQAYQTLGSQGFKTPLRAIHAVTTDNGRLLNQYPVTVDQSIDPNHVYLILQAMQSVMHNGTGRSFYNRFPESMSVAGKTGTTNDYRDSWFAGITGDKLAVIWLGADDNSPIGLTGSSGALKVWTDVMATLKTKSLELVAPDRISVVKVNLLMNQNGKAKCYEDYVMPYVSGSRLSEKERISCTND